MIWPFRRRVPIPKPAPLDAAAIVRRARRLRFRVRPDAVSQLAGAYHGARPGIGLTFAELRAYEPGDDVRHLDWNVTARQGRPFVRRFVEERALCLWLVVDVSASMRFGPERKTKADRAAQAAALLATAAIQNGDRAGLILVSDRIEVELPPAGGVRHLSQLVRALVATPTTSPKTRLSVGLARVRRTARRAMIVVISDFISEEPIATWRRAARRHDTIALRVVDPREDQLPDAGLLVLEDAEKGATRTIDTSSKRVRKQYCRDRRPPIGGVPALVHELGHPGVHHDDRHRPDRPTDRAVLPPRDPPRSDVNGRKSPGTRPPSAQPRAGTLARARCDIPPSHRAGDRRRRTVVAARRLGLAATSPPRRPPIARLVGHPGRRRSDAARPARGPLRDDPRRVDPQFGVSCRAKTTEELSADERLAELLGADAFQELMQFLDRIDLLKFAPHGPTTMTGSSTRR